MAANSESFVSPRRGGGSGAAAILTPSTAINDVFKTYDAQRTSKAGDAYYDALGYDIKQGLEGAKGISNLNDRAAIEKKKNDVVNLQSKIYYSKQPYSSAPQAYNEYYQGKQNLIDLTSKGLRDQATYEASVKEVNAKDYKYDKPKSMEIIQKWYDTPIEQRPPRPELVQIDPSNYNKIFKDFGNKGHIIEDVHGSFVDGTGSQTRIVRFDEQGARRDWENTVAGNYNTANMKRIFAVAADRAKEAVGEEEWNQLPVAVQKEAINAEAEDWYVDTMKSMLQLKSSRTSTVTNKEKKGATPQVFDDKFSVTAKLYPQNGGTVKRVATLSLVGLQDKDKESATQSWKGISESDGTETNVVGKAQRVIQEEGKPAYIEVSVVTPDGNASFEYVPYAKNKDKVVNDYGVDFYKDRPASFNKKYEDVTINPSDIDRGANETDEDFNKRVKSWTKAIENFNNRKKQSAPASKAVGKKDRVPPKNEM